MNSLYRKYSIAAIVILSMSIIIGFVLANVIYYTVAKQKIDAHNVETAQGIVNMLFADHYEEVLVAMAEVGYQLILIDAQDERQQFGEPFTKDTLSQAAVDDVLSGGIYHGMETFTSSMLMMGHFSNTTENTVGVPFSMNGEQYALFLRPDNDSLFSDMHAIVVGFIVAVAAVSLIGVFIMTRKLLRPIDQLTKATKAIANENYTYELDIERNDEIGQLATSFRTMQQQLQHNQLATKAFINNVSHDFQSPLMNIQGYTQLLQHEHTDDQRAQYSGIIHEEAKRLSNVTKQLLVLTSLDQPSYPLKKETVHIDEQLREIIRKYHWRLAECEFDVSHTLQPARISGDRELLMTVWDNLLSNAMKYTAEGGTIAISCTSDDKEVVIRFQDDGIGLTTEQAARIFDRFYRVDKARKKDGTGLGLAIVKEIIEMHNGVVDVDSVFGFGTTFTVKIPR